MSDQKACIIWMHGLGDSGDGWCSLAGEMKLPKHVKWVFPDAPDQRVSCNGGMRMPSWFDITEIPITPALKDPEDSCRQAVQSLHELIQEQENEGYPAERIVVGGFSQGGALAVAGGLSYPKKLGGIVSFSGWMFSFIQQDLEKWVAPAQKETPVLCCHGMADQVVQFKAGTMIQSKLTELEHPVAMKSYPGIPHTACPEEFKDLKDYLSKQLIGA